MADTEAAGTLLAMPFPEAPISKPSRGRTSKNKEAAAARFIRIKSRKAKAVSKGSNGGGKRSKMFRKIGQSEWEKAMETAPKTAFNRLKMLSSKDPNAIIERLTAGAIKDPKTVRQCFLVTRDDKGSKSPIQVQVSGARIVAQKVIYAAYHKLGVRDLGTWQVRQTCCHPDGNWWCFEPSHLEKCEHDHVRIPMQKHPLPGPADAVYQMRTRPMVRPNATKSGFLDGVPSVAMVEAVMNQMIAQQAQQAQQAQARAAQQATGCFMWGVQQAAQVNLGFQAQMQAAQVKLGFQAQSQGGMQMLPAIPAPTPGATHQPTVSYSGMDWPQTAALSMPGSSMQVPKPSPAPARGQSLLGAEYSAALSMKMSPGALQHSIGVKSATAQVANHHQQATGMASTAASTAMAIAMGAGFNHPMSRGSSGYSTPNLFGSGYSTPNPFGSSQYSAASSVQEGHLEQKMMGWPQLQQHILHQQAQTAVANSGPHS